MGPGCGLGCHGGGQGVTVLAHLGVRFGYLENCSSKISLSELEEISGYTDPNFRDLEKRSTVVKLQGKKKNSMWL